MRGEPTYLGDGVTVEADGFQLKVTADGAQTVYLPPEQFAGLLRFAVSKWEADPEWLKQIIDQAAADRRMPPVAGEDA